MSLSRTMLPGLLLGSMLIVSCGGYGGREKPLETWQPQSGTSRLSVEHDGFERDLLVQLPSSYDPDTSYPLVLAFHGAGRSCDDWPDWLAEVAGSHDFIGIYPQGLRHYWESEVDNRRVDDISFVSALIAWADTTLALDDYRRYAVGFSQGAIFLNHLACRNTGLAGIAAISGTFYQHPNFAPVRPPRKIFLAHGTRDGVIPYEGGMNDSGYSYQAAETSALMWSRALGCNQDPVASIVSERITEIRYTPCRGAGEVLLLKVDSGHHLQDTVDGLFTMIWDFWESGW